MCGAYERLQGAVRIYISFAADLTACPGNSGLTCIRSHCYQHRIRGNMQNPVLIGFDRNIDKRLLILTGKGPPKYCIVRLRYILRLVPRQLQGQLSVSLLQLFQVPVDLGFAEPFIRIGFHKRLVLRGQFLFISAQVP